MNRNAKSILRITVIVLFCTFIVGYTIFQAWKIISGPVIDVYSPKTGTTYTEALIDVEGRAKNAAYLNLNGRPIFTDTTGYFKENVLLSPGYNVIKLDAQDKFKKYTEKQIEIVLKE